MRDAQRVYVSMDKEEVMLSARPAAFVGQHDRVTW